MAAEWSVLIADDEPAARRGVRQLLAAHPDFAVVGECRDGAEVLETLDTLAPDIVFLDISMPGVDGLGVVRRLRLDPHFQKVPFVAVTGRGSEEDRRLSREAGFDEHLVKPVALESLQRVFATL